jgi:hypothetical protein
VDLLLIFKGIGISGVIGSNIGFSGIGVEANSIPTGTQTVQVIGAYLGNATTIKGTVIGTIINIMVVST